MRNPGANILQRFWHGARLPFRAVFFLAGARGIRRYALLPLLLNTLLYGLVLGLAFWAWFHYDLVHFDWTFWKPVGPWLSALANRVVEVAGTVLFAVLLLAAAYVSFTAVGMVVASPFNDLLSERVEERLRGVPEAPQPPALAVWNAVYSTLCSLLIGLQQLGCVLLALPLLLVPVLGIVCFFLVNAYFTGIGFLDVPMARRGMRLSRKRAMLRELRWEVLGLGACMQLLFMIPLAGLLLLPAGVVAGTMLFARRLDPSPPFPCA